MRINTTTEEFGMSLETKIISAIRQAVDDRLIEAESEEDGGNFVNAWQHEFIERLILSLSPKEKEEFVSEWVINEGVFLQDVCVAITRKPKAPLFTTSLFVADKLLSHYQEHADQRLNELAKGI